jgi:hypothetical protein
LCHCSTCQQPSGGPYSCGQIIPKKDLIILTGEPKVYTYTGASGQCVLMGLCLCLYMNLGLVADDFGRETGSVLLLWELHEPYLSPPGSDAG